ncbi:LOW QUALITY PROTEIN: solute carrier family 2 member 9, like 1 [Neoarius graeffei]|uniref:LOW QUALITY PROTEIN: solute carrier family 2 member 9, like 1 n=1 Tax=Neoarius graeffei TaxID=443677 RepID=UPI00298D1AA7|nr:LOW QUALITY PROTEIN: solute carrier family 2 member 9, like 1 [Neoarius graeffei]
MPHHHDQLSISTLQGLWGPGEYKLEIEEMQLEQATLNREDRKSVSKMLRDLHVHGWQCLTLVIICVAISFCGISGIGAFAYGILKEVGIPVDKIQLYITLGIRASEVLTSITCVSYRLHQTTPYSLDNHATEHHGLVENTVSARNF